MFIYVGNNHQREVVDLYKQNKNICTLVTGGTKAIKYPKVPYSLDNGAFGLFKKGLDFDFENYYSFLDKWFSRHLSKPNWVVVPDSVGNRKKTIKYWNIHSDRIAQYGYPLAIAVQDGMIKSDIPSNVDVVFIGGSTEWKLKTIPYWCAHFHRVHVGRAGGWQRMWMCYKAGAESVDGTGFFRGGPNGNGAINLQLFSYFLSGNYGLSEKELRYSSLSKRKLILNEILGIKTDFSDLPLFAKAVTQIT